MRVSIKSKNSVVPDVIRVGAEKGGSRIARYFREMQSLDADYRLERGIHVVELATTGDGIAFRCEERAGDVHAAIDNAVEKMERQVQRFKDRLRDGRRRPAPVRLEAPAADGGELDDNTEPVIARRKRYLMKPMPPDEALEQIDMVDHPFFVFRNSESGDINVIYRRHDGSFGLIEPAG